jgi:hypothetical protein
LWLAFASLVGVFIAGTAVAPVATFVMFGSVALLSSGLGGDAPLLRPERVPIALRLLTEGFAAFAAAVFLFATAAAIYAARRVAHSDDDASTPAIVFATVVAVEVAAGTFFLGPYWLRTHLGPTGLLLLVGGAALAGTIPARTDRRVSPWWYACLALIVAAPLGVEAAWRFHLRPRPIERPPAVARVRVPSDASHSPAPLQLTVR